MTNDRRIYTIGHSSLSMDGFLNLLRANDVTAIADVRSQPFSKMYPHFSQPPLKRALLEAGFHYVFLGQELGARRDEPETYVDGQARYDLVAATPAFREGIKRVVEGAASQRVALLCAEKDPLVCHRSILVCRELRGHGLDIRHILNDGSIETLVEAERRLMEEEGLKPDQLGLFESDDTRTRVERAYELRGAKIAYRVKEEER